MLLNEIRKERKRQGLSQEQLAKNSGLSRCSIINYESGRRDPKIKDLKKIARALNVSVTELIGQEKA